MGVTETVISTLHQAGLHAELIDRAPFSIIKCSKTVFLNFISFSCSLKPEECIALQEAYQKDGKLLVHLWEDVWNLNQGIVISRIKSFLGLNKTYHGRKAKIVEVTKESAQFFFNSYHLQGFVNAKFYYGLSFDGEIMAMASFSALRPMRSKGDHYKSAELVRFAAREGCTVNGGLSKLIKHFLSLTQPNDLMSYADRDWSLGWGYDRLGFRLTTITPSSELYIELASQKRFFLHRLPKSLLLLGEAQNDLTLDQFLTNNGFAKAFNTGNLKYHLLQ